MGITITIAGVDRTSSLEVDTLKISDELNNRSTADFDLAIIGGAWKPAVGQSVLIKNKAGTAVFGGTIDTLDAEPFSENNRIQAIRYTVACVDNSAIADRHLIAAVYSTNGQTLSTIVNSIVSNNLVGEGISTTGVQTGPTVVSAIWNYDTVAKAFNDLAQLTGYAWWIDANKVLNFCARDAIAAPFVLTDTSANYRKIKLSTTRNLYRNRQYVRAGTDVTPSRTETRIGDGHTRAFTLTYNVALVPTSITLNGTAQTIGIKGVDSGKQWYWNQGSAIITQDDTGTVLASTDTLSVTYQGQFPIIVQAQDDAQISTMSANEGGSGIYEAITDEPNVNSAAMATADATGYIRRYGVVPQIVSFETDADGLASGQLITITNSLLGISGSWLIDKVDAKDQSGRFLRYTVEALSGEHIGGWIEFFRHLVEQGQTYVIRNNEVVTYLRSISQSVTASESLSYTTGTPNSLCDSAQCDNFAEAA